MTGDQSNSPAPLSTEAVTWIYVSERLPDYGTRALLKCTWGSCKPSVRIGFRKSTDKDGEHWSFDGENNPRESWRVVGWMPLPEDCSHD